MNYQRLSQFMFLYAIFAFIAYHMPWHLHPTAAFSNNAFDLAEFTSLHPNVRNESLYTSLLLRAPLLFMAFIITLSAACLEDERWQWLWRGAAILIVLRLNPPVEFYPYGGGSINDQQMGQLMIAGLVMIGIVTTTGRWLKRIYHPLLLIATGIMLYTAYQGMHRATELLENGLVIPVDTGGGAILFAAAGLTAHIYIWWDWLRLKLNFDLGPVKTLVQYNIHK